MSEKVIQHQVLHYKEGEPFHFYEIKSNGMELEATESSDPLAIAQGSLFDHWHEDLEFCYCIQGRAYHHINGELVEDIPGRLIAVNSEFIHNIVPDPTSADLPGSAAIIVIIKSDFVKANFPEYKDFYFTNETKTASPAIAHCMEKIHQYVTQTKYTSRANLYGKSLVMELLYLACQQGTVLREQVSDVNVEKDIERMKGILSYIENHYREHLTQAQVADKFYFSSIYFSKYFKQCTGMTFTDYVARYRAEQGRKELLATGKSVTEIALDNGFSDDRRFILTFKKYYDDTPLQYRKNKQKMKKTEIFD
jgi:AraC-like DNA-binding protein